MRWPLGRPWCGSGLWNAGIFQVSLNYYRHWNLINKQYDWCFTILIISWFCFSLYVMLNLLFEIWNIALYLNCKKGMENSKSKIVMFVWVEFIVPLENFSLIWRRHHCRWKLQILICARGPHSWPLSSEGSLTSHTNCDTDLPFIQVFSEDPWRSNLLPSVWQWSCHYLFLRLRSIANGDQTPISCMRGERSTSSPPRRFLEKLKSPLIFLPYF